MSTITLRTIQKSRKIAQEKIDKTGYLTMRERCELLDMASYNDKISVQLSHTIWVFTEIISARFTQKVWQDNTLPPFKTLPVFLLNIAYDQYISHANPNYRQKISWQFNELVEDFGDYELSGEDFGDKYLDKAPNNRNNQDLAVKVHSSLRACSRAVDALDNNRKIEPLISAFGFDTDPSSKPDNDYEAWWAADLASKATDLTPKEFWTWYIGDCLSQALKDAQSMLAKA